MPLGYRFDPPRRVMFLYLGRRVGRLTLDTARAACEIPGLEVSVCVSAQVENMREFAALGERLTIIDTFSKTSGALTEVWRVPKVRQTLRRTIRERNIEAVIEVMGHIWSPIIVPTIARAGARYTTIVHDARPHSGDWTGLFMPFSTLARHRAERVVTLSQSVTRDLVADGMPIDKIRTLFLPYELHRHEHRPITPHALHAPLRFLFYGRMYRYKGLALFVDALEILRRQGAPFEASVVGGGDLGVEAERLGALGVKVDNRWLTDQEIERTVADHDVVVAPYIGASQSGVVVAAFGAGKPVIVTPVGGLVEQVSDGVTGLVASAVSGEAVAESMARLIADRPLFEALRARVLEHRETISPKRFAFDCAQVALGLDHTAFERAS